MPNKYVQWGYQTAGDSSGCTVLPATHFWDIYTVIHICYLINPRTPRGGGYHPPWRFSPVTFLMIPIAKIASSYLLLGMGDTFWHMWHHLDAVTWHMSWRQMYMTVVKIHCFYHCLLIEISFDVDEIK